MGRSHRLLRVGVLLITLVAIGCASTGRTRSRAPVSPVASHPVVRNGAGGSDAAGDDQRRVTAEEATPNALAQHADAYARNVEAMLQQRMEAAAKERAAAGEVANKEPESQPRKDETPAPKGPPAVAEAKTREQVRVDVDDEPREPVVANAPMKIAPGTAPPVGPATQPSDRAETARLNLPAESAKEDDLLGKLSARVREYPRDAAAHLEYQLLQFLRDEPVPDLGAIAALPSEDRELLTTLLDGLANFRNGLRADANMLQSKKVSPLLELSDRLRSQGELSIPVAALCSDVKLFGVYEPLEPARFTAGGKDNKAILYFEVANFSSQLNAEKKYETRLKQEAVLYAEAGLAVWRDKEDTVVDKSRNRRHDFFIADIVKLPETLPMGRYLLKVTVTDLHVNRVAEATVPVEIVAQ